MTLPLADFLLARIADDEVRVRAGYPFDSWDNHEDDYEWDSDKLFASWHTAHCGHRYGESMTIGGDECTCGVPARVLVECAAKRRLIAMHTPGPLLDHYEYGCTCGYSDHRWAECQGCGVTVADEGELKRQVHLCPTLRLLALPYADHPDYREEWRA